jgi:putative ABC transport system substrate-binding protein
MRRRDFIKLITGSAAVWPLAARAQQPAMPIVAFINGGSAKAEPNRVSAFRKGLSETGYTETGTSQSSTTGSKVITSAYRRCSRK